LQLLCRPRPMKGKGISSWTLSRSVSEAAPRGDITSLALWLSS
jgi:hypothetical protein